MSIVLSIVVSLLTAQEPATASSVSALSKTVAAQAQIIKKLEKQLNRLGGKGSCAATDDDDAEPELRPFRITEEQKRAQKKQDELLTLFTTEVRP